jgi:hypothetical protein
MSNSYWTFLDYLELRRRVERRIWRGKWLLGNIVAFVLAAAVFSATSNAYAYGYAVEPSTSYFMTFWSIGLALHGILTFFKSGAWIWRRNQAVEDEMRARLQNDESYMSDNPNHLFNLHKLLENNIGARSESVVMTTVFTIVNAIMWVSWTTLSTMSGSQPWQLTGIFAMLILLPVLIASLIHGVKYEQALRKKIETLEETAPQQESASKQKRFAQQAHMRLSDDGELITIDDDMDGLKQKRRV